MRCLLVAVLLRAAPVFAARPVIKEFAPVKIAVGSGERFAGIVGSNFTSGSHGPRVIYSGPAGTFELTPNSIWGFEPELRIQVWIPGEIVNTIGRYSVIVRNEINGDSDPVFFDVTGESRIVLTVPPFVHIEATSPAGAIVSYDASAESTNGEPVALSCAPASGSTFPIGRTDVVCTASMSDGATRSMQFPVSVLDRTPPVLTVPEDIVVEATGNEGRW